MAWLADQIVLANAKTHLPVADVAALKALDTTSVTAFPDGTTIFLISSNGLYVLNRTSAAAEDLGPPVAVVTPTAGAGRWLASEGLIGAPQLQDNACLKVKKLHIVTVGAAEVSTAWALPAKAFVLTCVLDVTVNVAGQTVSVGILAGDPGADADGFLALASANAVAIVDGPVGVLLPNYLHAGTPSRIAYTPSAGGITADIYILYHEFA